MVTLLWVKKVMQYSFRENHTLICMLPLCCFAFLPGPYFFLPDHYSSSVVHPDICEYKLNTAEKNYLRSTFKLSDELNVSRQNYTLQLRWVKGSA